MDELDRFLIDAVLPTGWRILAVRDVQRDVASACRNYTAEGKDGRRAFVKVLDPRANGSLEEARQQLNQFIYENHIAEVCAARNLRRVIKVLAGGSIQTPPPFSMSLHYLVFEWGPSDVRSYFNADESTHLATVLRWLHHTATAIEELHYSEIVHQDVRPANVVVMPNNTAKLGGLSRAFHVPVPREAEPINPDATYLAPERLYGDPVRSLDDRMAQDMYAFGSSAFFLLCGVSLNAAIANKIDPMHHWSNWSGTFDDVLPYVVAAFDAVMVEETKALDSSVTGRLLRALRELCYPNPKNRGSPNLQLGNREKYSMRGYVSLFNRLARERELSSRKKQA